MDYDYGLEDESTLAKKLQLEMEIRDIKQGERSIQELFDVMTDLWDQMPRLEPTKSSSYIKAQEDNHLIQFLLALRDEFGPFKRSLLNRVLVPSLQDVVSELKTEEARLRSSSGYFEGKGKLAVESTYDEPLSTSSFLSVKKEESEEPAVSEGIIGNMAKFAAASRAVVGSSSALSDYISGSGNDSSTVKILTYNVCFWDLALRERMKALGRLIQLHTPDIICFQEVTSIIYSIFEQSSWWGAYDCSVSFEEAARGHKLFCMQLSKLPVKSFGSSPFRNSRMGRELCMAEIQVCSGKSLIVATSHLESPMPQPPPFDQKYSEQRVAQATAALDYLQSSQNVIFCGDMNWDDEVDGRFPLPQGWIDAWTQLRPWLKGWTCDTKSNQMLAANRPLQKRLDRFLSKLNDFKLEKINMIGTEAIPGVSYLKEKRVGNRVQTLKLPVLPSDHYGLLLEIHCNENKT